MIRISLLIIFWLVLNLAQGQDKNSEFSYDSTYVEVDNRWSLRAYSVLKFQSIKLTNKQSGDKVRYLPSNPLGIGLGFAYRYVVVDLGINLRLDRLNEASQFDFQGTAFIKGEILDVFAQRYQGFNQRDKLFEKGDFRQDIKTWAVGLNYLHNFSAQQLSLSSAFQGVSTQKKSKGGFTLGGYFSYYQLRADSSLIPSAQSQDFNAFAQIVENNFANLGIMVGYAHSWVFPRNYFIFTSFFPGIGFNFGSIEGEADHEPALFPAGKLNYRVAVGRATRKNYIILSFSMDDFLINIGNGNRYQYSIGKLKLVVGFRMNSKLKGVEKVIP